MNRFPTNVSVIDRIIIAVARVKLQYVIFTFCLFGAFMFGRGIYAEFEAQVSLRQSGGVVAVEQYHARMRQRDLDVVQYVTNGLRGELRQNGANLQLAGMAVMYVGSLFAMLFVLAARGILIVQIRLSPVAGGK